MADISKILTEAWLKVNEGIGSAANTIADATKGKVNEINLLPKLLNYTRVVCSSLKN